MNKFTNLKDPEETVKLEFVQNMNKIDKVR